MGGRVQLASGLTRGGGWAAVEGHPNPQQPIYRTAAITPYQSNRNVNTNERWAMTRRQPLRANPLPHCNSHWVCRRGMFATASLLDLRVLPVEPTAVFDRPRSGCLAEPQPPGISNRGLSSAQLGHVHQTNPPTSVLLQLC